MAYAMTYLFCFCALTFDLKQQAEGYEVVPALMLDYIDRKNIAAQFVLLFSIYNRSHQREVHRGRMMKPLCQRRHEAISFHCVYFGEVHVCPLSVLIASPCIVYGMLLVALTV